LNTRAQKPHSKKLKKAEKAEIMQQIRKFLAHKPGEFIFAQLQKAAKE